MGGHVIIDMGLGDVGDDDIVAIITATGAGGHGGGCCCHHQVTWGMMLGFGGHGGVLSLPLLGNAGAGDLGGCIILMVIAVCHRWMMLGAGWACWH